MMNFFIGFLAVVVTIGFTVGFVFVVIDTFVPIVQSKFKKSKTYKRGYIAPKFICENGSCYDCIFKRQELEFACYYDKRLKKRKMYIEIEKYAIQKYGIGGYLDFIKTLRKDFRDYKPSKYEVKL